MENTQLEERSQTKQRLIDAYWDLYLDPEAGKITVKMLTDLAGYNRSTFYAHFLDLEDLQDQAENDLLPTEEDFASFKEATFSKNTQAVLELFMKIDKTSGKKINYLLGPRGSLAFQARLKNKLKDLIKNNLPLNFEVQDRVVEYKSEILYGLFFQTIQYWYERGSQVFEEKEIISLMEEIVFSGLVDPKLLLEGGSRDLYESL